MFDLLYVALGLAGNDPEETAPLEALIGALGLVDGLSEGWVRHASGGLEEAISLGTIIAVEAELEWVDSEDLYYHSLTYPEPFFLWYPFDIEDALE